MKATRIKRRPRRRKAGQTPLVTGGPLRAFGAEVMTSHRLAGPDDNHLLADVNARMEEVDRHLRKFWTPEIRAAAFDPMFSDIVTETEDGRGLAGDLIPNWDPAWRPRRFFRGLCFGGFALGSVGESAT